MASRNEGQYNRLLVSIKRSHRGIATPMVDSPQTSNHLVVRLLGDPHDDAPDHWQFTPGKTVHIGRSSISDIRLPEEKISRLHATLSHNGSDWVCSSVGRNGVFHENRPVAEIILTDGMVLQFVASGPRLHFQLVGAAGLELDADHEQSVVDWLENLATGDADAASHLWEEYFDRVVRLARTRIAARQRRITDEEDVAVSVFESICAGMQAGRFPDLKSRDSLWRLLCVITKRKVTRHAKHERRQKRGGGLVRGESVFVGAGGADSQAFGFDQIGGANDTDIFSLQLAEQAEWLFEVLGDVELRKITELKLAECTNEEIATELGCHVRTVKRRLQTIRSILQSALAPDD